jgi:hypothetical protein
MCMDQLRKLTSQSLVAQTANDPAGPIKHLTSVRNVVFIGGVIYLPGNRNQKRLVAVRFVPGVRMQIAGFLASCR